MIYERITEVTVCAVPENNINHGTYAVQIQWRGGETYAVHWFKRCLSVDGEWDFESIPSEREDEWIARHRFSYLEALRLAAKVAPTIRMNGRTAAEVAADA